MALEYERNGERYRFVKWAQQTYENISVIPPGMGILHQVNVEHIARVVWSDEVDGRRRAYPDTMLGMDSHTPMINALSIFGWGVGGLEAGAAMLGQAVSMLIPNVVGVRVVGRLPEGTTTTDAVLTVTERLRAHGVVGKFVEYFGPGLDHLALTDRATLSNMSPEYGATMGFFPIDDRTLEFLETTGRAPDQIALVEAYAKEQGLWREAEEPVFTETVEIDLSDVEPCLAGPFRPNQRTPLGQVPKSYHDAMADTGRTEKAVSVAGAEDELRDGAVVLAAITSCTNTSNPAVMLGAGLFGAECGSPRFTQQTVGENLAVARLRGRGGLSYESGPAGRSRCARLSRHGVWLHELWRAFGPVAGTDRFGDTRQRPRCRCRPFGQPELRRAGARPLPG